MCCACGASHSNQCTDTNMRLSFEMTIHYNHCNYYQSNFPIWSSYRHEVQMKVPTSTNTDTKYFMLLYLCSYGHHKSSINHFLPYILLLATTYEHRLLLVADEYINHGWQYNFAPIFIGCSNSVTLSTETLCMGHEKTTDDRYKRHGETHNIWDWCWP
jgi:hypothetical protein